MARIASSRPDGSGADLAFDLVRNMRDKYAAIPRLRTYGPALFAVCRQLEAEKAYALANHMVSSAIMPEEPEIAALLDVSAKLGFWRIGSTASLQKRWEVNRTSVGADGHFAMCFRLLDCVDIAHKETKEFADSVANLAMEKESHVYYLSQCLLKLGHKFPYRSFLHSYFGSC